MEIDQTLKQRLVGVVVITALATIFVPMLFDDPIEDDGQSISELTIPPSPEESIEKSVLPVQKSAEQVLAIPVPEDVKEKMEQTPNTVEEPSKPQIAELGRWVIQAGSFGQKENALELKDQLKKQGFTAYLDSVKTDQGQMMYRVRIGPELDKGRAEATRKKIEEQNKIKTFLVNE